MSAKRIFFTRRPHKIQQPSTNTRRTVLKGTLAAGASLPFVPSQWTRPVVDSVFLPAHAQTSGPCRDDSPLTDFTSSCSDLPASGVQYNITDHSFSICDGELVFERVSYEAGSSPGAPSDSGILRVIEILDTGDNPVPRAQLTAYADGYIIGAYQGCPQPTDLGPQQGQSSLFVEGNEYTATATVSRSAADASVSLTGISVTPAP